LTLRPPFELLQEDFTLDQTQAEAVEKAYQATFLAYLSWDAVLSGDSNKANEALRAALALNPKDRWIGFSMADRLFSSLENASVADVSMPREQALLKILEIRPDHIESLKALLSMYTHEGKTDRAAEIIEKIRALEPGFKT
jgi:spermidine synthase